MGKTTALTIIDLSRQFINMEKDLIDIFVRVGRSGSYVLGKELANFEENFAEYCETSYAIGVGNATDGLAILLKAVGIRPGDEVITAANSFIASAGAIVEAGAIPVFVDVKDDYNIDPKAIEQAISIKTKAIMPVHLTGKPAQMDLLRDICNTHDLRLIEDAAQSIGARFKNKKVGSLGDGAVFSLHPLKNLHVYGDGGVITTSCPHIYNRCLQLRNHGLIDRDTCGSWGRNSRLDELQAAIANYKLSRIDLLNARFRQIAASYNASLKEFVTVPTENKNEFSVYHNYVIISEQRDNLKNYLKDSGIDTKIRYPKLLSSQPASLKSAFTKLNVPKAKKISKSMLSLPIFPEMTDSEINRVSTAIIKFFTKGD